MFTQYNVIYTLPQEPTPNLVLHAMVVARTWNEAVATARINLGNGVHIITMIAVDPNLNN